MGGSTPKRKFGTDFSDLDASRPNINESLAKISLFFRLSFDLSLISILSVIGETESLGMNVHAHATSSICTDLSRSREANFSSNARIDQNASPKTLKTISI